MPLIPFNGIMPKVHESAFVAENAYLIGDVTVGEGSSIWYNVVVRGDVHSIIVGRNVNIQDNSTVHSDLKQPTVIGDGVSVGHNAVVHGCTVGKGALIGIHATVLSGAKVGELAIVGAGAVVGEGREIPSRRLAMGIPARVVRELTEEDLQRMDHRVQHYVDMGGRYRSSGQG